MSSTLSAFPGVQKPRHFPHWLFALGLSLLLSGLVVLPFFWLGTASGHDVEFHAASWLDVAYQWKEGILYPRWSAWANHGFGEPRFVFYPPLSWMVGALLTLVCPDAAIPIVFVVLVQTLAGISAYFLLCRWATPQAALLGAGFYAINPYALLLTYVRSDFAEQLACALFPLVLLAALRMGELLEEPPPKPSDVVPFALAFAGVWLSNAPAGVVVSYSMALLFAWAALIQRSWRILFRGMAGLALGFGLAGFYLVPAAYEQRWVNISQTLSSGLLPRQNFLFTFIDDVEHTWFNWIASLCALLLMLLFGLAVLGSRSFSVRKKASAGNRKWFVALLVLGTAATLLTLKLSLPLWTYLPKLRFVQFPWRWMSVIAVVAVCFLAPVLQKWRAWVVFAVIVVLSGCLAAFLVTNTWWDEDEMPTMREALTSGRGFDGTDEYDPLGDDHLDLPLDAPLVKVLPADPGGTGKSNVGIQIQRWTTEDKELHIDAPSEARMALRLLNYPAWHVERNGKTIQPERLDDVNQMVVPVEAGSSEIRVHFARTFDRKVGNAISVVSGALGVLRFWLGGKQHP